jgi:hypothetical protein
MFGFISIGPLVFLYFFIKNWDKLEEEAYISRLGEVIENINLKNSGAKYYYFLYTTRRFIFLMSTIFLYNY